MTYLEAVILFLAGFNTGILIKVHIGTRMKK